MEIGTIIKFGIEESSQIIAVNRANVEHGSTILKEAASILKEIYLKAEEVTLSTEKILNSSQKQSEDIELIGNAAKSLEVISNENNTTSEKIAQTGTNLEKQIKTINKVINQLNQIVTGEN